ncbi:hypothetical protein ACU8L5_35160 (plasmid) [Rhizobium leguminosarum]|jgi:glutamine synthetase|uniref:hypothetical protein n=1 Tax=Rhizobium leguminosarum TaxID=384 RepID=UPI003F9E0E64
MPDPTTAQMDPFLSMPTLTVICNRGIAEKGATTVTHDWNRRHGVYVRAEPEFFVFDDVKYQGDPYNTGKPIQNAFIESFNSTTVSTRNLRPSVS